MIYLRNTGESFSDIYIAREAVLNFARICDPKEHMKTELVLDAGEYVLSSPLVFSKEENPELENISLSITFCTICNFSLDSLTNAIPLYNNNSGASRRAHCIELLANLGKNSL